MKLIKKSLSVVLSFLMIFTTIASCFVLLPELSLKADAAINTDNTIGDLAFYVPEAIYLYPNVQSTTNSTTTPFQYYIENTVNTGSIYSQPSTSSTKTKTGHIYFAYQNATSVTFSYSFVAADMSSSASGSVTLGSASPSKTSNYFTTTVTGGNATLAASATGCYIQWKAAYVDSVDGVTKYAVAYTYVYKPYVVPFGSALHCKNTEGYSSFGCSLAWVSGVHSITGHSDARKPNYMTSSSGKGFAAFLSDDNVGYVGNTKVTGSMLQKTWYSAYTSQQQNPATWYNTYNGREMYSVFASTDPSQAYFYGDQSGSGYNNNCSDNWSNGSSTFNVNSIDYYGDSRNPSCHDLLVIQYARPKGNLYIDTSRYSNLNQIPNLGVGLMVTDDESSGYGQSWYVADNTGINDYLERDYYQADDNDIKNRFNSHGTIIAQHGGTGTYDGGDNDDEGPKYLGAWTRALTSASSQAYRVSMWACIREDSRTGEDNTCCNKHILEVNATQVNKASLRTAVYNAQKAMAKLGITSVSATAFGSRYYNTSNSAWTTFVTAYKNASKGLTCIDASCDAASLASALNTAVTALVTNKSAAKTGSAVQYSYLRNHNGSGWTYTEIPVASELSKDYYYGDNVKFTAEAISNYVYAGYSDVVGTVKSTASTVQLNQVATDITNYYYYFEPAVYTVTLDNQSATTAGTTAVYEAYGEGVYLNKTNFPLMSSSANAITVPTKSGYVFGGYYTAVNGGGVQLINANGYITTNFGSGRFTSDATVYAKWTPAKYTVTFNVNCDNGTCTTKTKIVTFDAAYSDTTLPIPTRPGADFIGWFTEPTGGTQITASSIVSIASNHTLYAHWDVLKYTITFVGEDGSVVDVQEVEYGVVPSATVPTKAPTATQHFTGLWNPTPVAVTGNATYTAVYSAVNHTASTPATCVSPAVCSCGTAFGALGDHNYGSLKAGKAANCVDAGVKAHYECSVCHKYFNSSKVEIDSIEIPVAATTHKVTLTKTEASNSTCSVKGTNAYYTCSACNRVYTNLAGTNETTVEAQQKPLDTSVNGHTYGAWVKNSGADTHTKECPVCSADTPNHYVTLGCTGGTSVRDCLHLAVCDVCHSEYGSVGAHTLTRVPAVAPVCTTGCIEYWHCSVCGKDFVDAEGTTEVESYVANHTYAAPVKEHDVPSTCNTVGHYDSVVKCSVCNTELSRTTVNYAGYDANNHADYGTYDAEVVTVATCKYVGVQNVRCNGCDAVVATKSITKDPANHAEYGTYEYVTKVATCKEVGSKDIKCVGCNAVLYAEDIAKDADNHSNYGTYDDVTLVPTCNTKGSKNVRCNGCDAIFDTVVLNEDPANHADYGTYEDVTLVPTCKIKGSKNVKCNGCDAVVDTVVLDEDPANHADYGTYDDVTLVPTCKTKGSKNVKCNGCDAVVDTVVLDEDPANHADYGTYEDVTLVPTCKIKGSKDIKCNGCDAVVDTVVLDEDPANHADYGTYEDVTLVPTCKTKGSKDIKCNGCDAVIDTVILDADPANHADYAAYDNVTLVPTCTDKGSKEVKCSGCDVVLETVILDEDPDNHADYNTYEDIAQQPDCIHPGKKYTRCSGCNAILATETLATITEHVYGGIEMYDAVSHKHSCTICGTTEKFAHEWDDGVITKEATAKEAGEKTFTCGECGATKTIVYHLDGVDHEDGYEICPKCGFKHKYLVDRILCIFRRIIKFIKNIFGIEG